MQPRRLPLIVEQDGIQHVLPIAADQEPSQTYEPIGPRTVLRMQDGSAVIQSRWAKWKTTLTVSGTQADSLFSLDFARPFDLWCVSAQTVSGTATAYALPRRRPDYAPVALAVLPDGSQVPTPLTLAGDVATLTPVAGAVNYRVIYRPILTVTAPVPARDAAPRRAEYRWVLEAEEV